MDEANRKGDELENIVREAAEKAQYTFDPKAWSAMEQKLNDADKVPFAWWKILFPVGVVAIILLLIFWPRDGEITQQTEGNQTTERQVNPASPDAKEPTQTTANSTEENPTNKDESTQAASVESKENGEASDRNVASDKTEQSTGLAADASAPRSTPNEQKEASEQSNQISISNSSNGRAPNPSQMMDLKANTSGGNNAQNELMIGSDRFLIKKALIPIWNPDPIQFPGTPGILVRKDSFGVEEVAEEVRLRKGGAWNFFVSGDLSGTSPSRLDRAGTMLGVTRESYIGKSWSLSFGAAYSILNYSALGEEYETPWWALRDPEAVESILANCIVIDIPINVRKYFDTKNGNSFFVSGGLSSYLMLREDYEYTYNEDKPAWADTWGIRNENKHFFGILNFSMGYERPLNEKLRLNIEPFVKIPLSGIGAGKVDLLSFGVNLAIKLDK